MLSLDVNYMENKTHEKNIKNILTHDGNITNPRHNLCKL